jgi:hypothetical protein
MYCTLQYWLDFDLELASYPNGMGYERNGSQRLWDPRTAGPRGNDG